MKTWTSLCFNTSSTPASVNKDLISNTITNPSFPNPQLYNTPLSKMTYVRKFSTPLWSGFGYLLYKTIKIYLSRCRDFCELLEANSITKNTCQWKKEKIRQIRQWLMFLDLFLKSDKTNRTTLNKSWHITWPHGHAKASHVEKVLRLIAMHHNIILSWPFPVSPCCCLLDESGFNLMGNLWNLTALMDLSLRLKDKVFVNFFFFLLSPRKPNNLTFQFYLVISLSVSMRFTTWLLVKAGYSLWIYATEQ